MNEAIRWCRGETRLGAVRLAARGGAIVGLWFEGQKHDVLPDVTWRETPGDPLLREAFRQKERLVFMDFITDETENVFPMVPGGKGLTEMILAEEL